MEQSKTSKSKLYNFLINASNQANLANSKNLSPLQINSVFVIISPYYIEKCNFEGIDLDIRMDEQGDIWIKGQQFKPVEVTEGVSVFGVSKR